MTPEIVLIRDGDQFLLLHGHLRLANVPVNYGSVHLDVRGEGIVRVTRNKSAYFVVQNGKWLPIVEGRQSISPSPRYLPGLTSAKRRATCGWIELQPGQAGQPVCACLSAPPKSQI